MTRTQATRPLPAPQIWRDDTAVALGDFGSLGARSWQDVASIEIFPGSQLGDEVLTLPETWLPTGTAQRLSRRTVDPKRAGVPDDAALAASRDESIRRALLALWLPHATMTGIRQSKPTTWLAAAHLLFDVARWQLDNRPSGDGLVFSHLTVSDFLTGIMPSLGRDERRSADIRALMRFLIDAGERGVISDWPKIYASGAADVAPIEKSQKGAGPIVRVNKTEERNWQPFPDEFVTEMIGRSLWLQEHLATPLLECFEGLRAIAAQAAAEGISSANPRITKRRDDYLRDFVWRDSSGAVIDKLPFPLMVTIDKTPQLAHHWPPRETKVVYRLVTTLQAANLSLVAFCTAARSSEIGDAKDLPPSPGPERLASRTFKLVREVGGEMRDWPLHPAAQRAYDIQCRLARSVRPEDADHLWVLTSGRDGGRLLNLTEPLVNAVEHLGLTDLAGADRAHAHRWRHTVARLVALSVIGAPQVLLDLFGHKDLDMTLRYMLSDPDVVEDAMKVARETAFVLADTAIEETLQGRTSGPAAGPLRSGLAALGMRRGETTFETTTIRETAEVLTFNSRHWELVRPGVLCTKTLGEFGPCTKGRGAPDPGGCRTGCDHRLELARTRLDCERTLAALLAELSAAEADGSAMVAASLEGQILAQLHRWKPVRERVLKEDAVARRIWEART